MSRKTLTESAIQEIVDAYVTSSQTMEDLAVLYGVSRRTIGRVLENKGVLSPIKRSREKDQAFLDMLAKYNVTTPEDLEKIFHTPVLVLPNILTFLKEATDSELAYLFYEAALAKVAERVRQPQPEKKEADHGRIIH